MLNYPWHALVILHFHTNEEKKNDENHVLRLWHTYHSAFLLFFFFFFFFSQNKTCVVLLKKRKKNAKKNDDYDVKGMRKTEKKRTYILQHITFDFSSFSFFLLFLCECVCECVFFSKDFSVYVGRLPTLLLLLLLLLLPSSPLLHTRVCKKKKRKNRRKNINYDDGDTGKEDSVHRTFVFFFFSLFWVPTDHSHGINSNVLYHLSAGI